MPEKIKNVLVTGTPNSSSRVIIKNSAGNTYNPSTKVFESGNNEIKVFINTNGHAIVPITLPELSSDDKYRLSLVPSAGVTLGEKIPLIEDKIKLNDYVPKTLTWTTSHTTGGYTIASALSTSFNGVSNTIKSTDDENALININLTGAISKSSALLYVKDTVDVTRATGGDFTNSNKPTYEIVKINPSTGRIILDGDTNLIDGMKLWGDKVYEDIAISKDGSNQITLSGHTYWPRFEIGDELTFTMGGWDVDLTTATIVNSGTTSLTATVNGFINRVGFDNTTITWKLQEAITTTPNASNQAVTCTAGSTVTVNCGLGDTDANAGAKTYARVAGPSRGSVGNNATAYDNNTFTGTSITYNNTSGSATDTDSFTFRCTDAGGTNSDTKTITITLT